MSISTSTAKIEKLKVDRQSLHSYIQKSQKEPVKSPRLTQCANEG